MPTTFRDIQIEYVNLVRRHFQVELDRYQQSALGLEQFIAGAAEGKSLSEVAGRVLNFVFSAERFWVRYRDRVSECVRGSTGLNVSLWQDSSSSSAVGPLSLYFDTVIVPDVFVAGPDPVMAAAVSRDYFGQCLRWAFAVESLAPFLVADTWPPLAAIVPQPSLFAEGTDDGTDLKNSAGVIAAVQFQILMGEAVGEVNWSNYTETLLRRPLSYFQQQMLAHGLRPLLTEPLFGSPVGSKLGYGPALIDRLQKGTASPTEVGKVFTGLHAAFAAVLQREAFASAYAAEPAVQEGLAPTVRRLNQVAASIVRRGGGVAEEALVAFSLQRRLPWLSSVDAKQCLALREQSGTKEVRELFRAERARLRNASFDEFETLAREMRDEFDSRLDEKERDLQKLLAENNRAALGTALSFTATVGISIVALLVPLSSLASTGLSLFGLVQGTASVKDVLKGRAKSFEIAQELGRPVPFLLDLRKAALASAPREVR